MTSDITERVRERYADAAQRVQGEQGCCGSGCCGGAEDAVTRDLYTADETSVLPEEAVLASLGCGNPTALVDLQEGQTVLDLGSGGGIDVLLSARRVGPTGFVYGVDMTEEMLALALSNKARAGISNVAFLKGRIEDIPLPADSVDVVISNCVINLAADKSPVLKDAFRVLKPGGRFAVADVVAVGPVPDSLRRTMEAWVGCIAGALEIEEYRRLLQEAGFAEIGVEITRRYTVAEAGLDPSTLPPDWEAADGKIASAFVRATKPATAAVQLEHPTAEASQSGAPAGLTPEQATHVEPFLTSLTYRDLSLHAAMRAGQDRYAFARAGVTITTTDALLAAVARERQATLVTSNLTDFPMEDVQLLSIRQHG